MPLFTPSPFCSENDYETMPHQGAKECSIVKFIGDGSGYNDYMKETNGASITLAIPLVIRNMKVTSIGPRALQCLEGVYKLNFGDPYALDDSYLKFHIKMIGSNAFSGCKVLNKVEIPDGVERIDSEAFSWCTNLELIILPSTLKSLGDNVFKCCEKLKRIEYGGTIESARRLFQNNIKLLDKVIVQCTDGEFIFHR